MKNFYGEKKYYLEYTVFGGHSSDREESTEIESCSDADAVAKARLKLQAIRSRLPVVKWRLCSVTELKGIEW